MRVWLASPTEKPALEVAYTAYTAALLPDEAPRRPDPYFDLYWQEPATRFPYLFGDDSACGFAFIRKLEEPDLDYEIAEFCVFPPHRKRGFGTRVLPQLFARHPGRWEASVLMTNQSGLGFWPVALKRAQVQSLRYREDAIARDFRFEVG